eukprot:scaffold121449_cov27-Prasinocladus_malaysianus.AAC.1
MTRNHQKTLSAMLRRQLQPANSSNNKPTRINILTADNYHSDIYHRKIEAAGDVDVAICISLSRRGITTVGQAQLWPRPPG